MTGVCLATFGVAAPAFAADASDWVEGQHSAVRLIAGARKAGETDLLRAGVEVKLAPGWKTYWRYPGDSGVPPRFDFTRSRNVESVSVAWPAPRRFSASGDQVIGYKGAVILPLSVKAADPAKPVELDLKLDYAICEKLCIPVEAEIRLELDGAGGAQEMALAAAEARIPRRANLGEGSLAITGISRDGGQRVVVDVAAPADTPIDLFVEGPTPDWALPLPELLPTADGRHRFAFDLDGLPSGTHSDGAALRFTLVSPQGSVEVTHALP